MCKAMTLLIKDVMKTSTIIKWRQNRQDPLRRSKVNQITLCDMMWVEEVKVALGGNNIFIGIVITTRILNLWQAWFGRWSSCSIQARFVASNELFWFKSSRVGLRIVYNETQLKIEKTMVEGHTKPTFKRRQQL